MAFRCGTIVSFGAVFAGRASARLRCNIAVQKAY